MKVEICLEAPMTKSSETMFVGTTNIGVSDEKIELKYNSETKRGYILVNNRWRWVKPQMKPVAAGSISIKQAWPGKRIFTLIAETEETPNPE